MSVCLSVCLSMTLQNPLFRRLWRLLVDANIAFFNFFRLLSQLTVIQSTVDDWGVSRGRVPLPPSLPTPLPHSIFSFRFFSFFQFFMNPSPPKKYIYICIKVHCTAPWWFGHKKRLSPSSLNLDVEIGLGLCVCVTSFSNIFCPAKRGMQTSPKAYLGKDNNLQIYLLKKKKNNLALFSLY